MKQEKNRPSLAQRRRQLCTHISTASSSRAFNDRETYFSFCLLDLNKYRKCISAYCKVPYVTENVNWCRVSHVAYRVLNQVSVLNKTRFAEAF